MMSDADAATAGRRRARTDAHTSSGATGRALRFPHGCVGGGAAERRFAAVADCAKVPRVHHLQCGQAGAVSGPRPAREQRSSPATNMARGRSRAPPLRAPVASGGVEGRRGPLPSMAVQRLVTCSVPALNAAKICSIASSGGFSLQKAVVG